MRQKSAKTLVKMCQKTRSVVSKRSLTLTKRAQRFKRKTSCRNSRPCRECPTARRLRSRLLQKRTQKALISKHLHQKDTQSLPPGKSLFSILGLLDTRSPLTLRNPLGGKNYAHISPRLQVRRGEFGAPGRIRTCDLGLRRPLFLSSELRGQVAEREGFEPSL